MCVCHPVPMVRICAVKPLQKIQRTYFKFKRVLNDILPATESIQDSKKSFIEFPVGSCRNHVGSIDLINIFIEFSISNLDFCQKPLDSTRKLRALGVRWMSRGDPMVSSLFMVFRHPDQPINGTVPSRCNDD